MALFDSPQTDYPKQWKEYSFDFKLMFGYHGCMMAMFMLGGFLSIKQELLIASVVASTLVSLSLRNRQENNWHWSGAGTKRVLAAVGIAVVASLFDFAALPSAPLSEPRVLPWHLAGLGIAVFGILGALNIVQLSQAEFIKECKATTGANSQNGPNAAVPLGPIDLLWKRVVRGAYYSVFFAAWLSAVSSFYFLASACAMGLRHQRRRRRKRFRIMDAWCTFPSRIRRSLTLSNLRCKLGFLRCSSVGFF